MSAKSLLIVRHGKARPPEGPDRNRALASLGEWEASTIAARVAQIDGCPDLIVSSDALRARRTAEIVASAVGYSDELVLEPSVYAADVDTLVDVVRGLPDSANCVLLVGHNPGLCDLGTALSTPEHYLTDLPTGGLIHLEFAVARWRDVRERTGKLVGVHSPNDI